MSDELTPDQNLAAEYALGLLEGEELLMARGRLARESEFASEVAFWEQRLAPMMDEVRGAEPSPELLQRILEETREEPRDSVVVTMQRKVQLWQRVAAGSAVAALAALSLFVLTPSQVVEPPQSGTPLVASMPIAETPLRLGVTYLPDSEELLVSASGLSADGVHDHELWLVPDDGSPLQSLGVVVPGEERRIALPTEITGNIDNGVGLVLTREPIGGKPEGQDAGPVVAEGALEQV